MQLMTTSKNFTVTKKCVSWPKKPQQDVYLQVENGNKEDKKENNNNIFQIM